MGPGATAPLAVPLISALLKYCVSQKNQVHSKYMTWFSNPYWQRNCHWLDKYSSMTCPVASTCHCQIVLWLNCHCQMSYNQIATASVYDSIATGNVYGPIPTAMHLQYDQWAQCHCHRSIMTQSTTQLPQTFNGHHLCHLCYECDMQHHPLKIASNSYKRHNNDDDANYQCTDSDMWGASEQHCFPKNHNSCRD